MIIFPTKYCLLWEIRAIFGYYYGKKPLFTGFYFRYPIFHIRQIEKVFTFLIHFFKSPGKLSDSYGKFEKLWQFSSYLIQHGCKIVEVNNSDNFLNYKNLPLLTEPSDKIIIRAMEEGRTNYVPHVINGNNYKIVVMGNKQYIPDVTAQQ